MQLPHFTRQNAHTPSLDATETKNCIQIMEIRMVPVQND